MRRGSKRRTLLARHAILLLALALLIPSSKTEAKIDPLRYLTDQVVRPEIIFVLDTSGSMLASIAGGTAGNDCSGHEAQIDICGDKMCSGHERWAPTSCVSNSDCVEHSTSLSCIGGKCRRGSAGTVCSDCKIFDDDSFHAGSSEQCYFTWSAPEISRMFLSKRAMRNVISEFRGVANFGLVTFGQTGYYHYQRADTTQSPVDTAIFLHEWELRSSGSWTEGKGWNTSGDAPRSSFLLGTPPPATTHVTYTLLNVTTCNPASTDLPCAGNSLYRAIEGYSQTADQSGDWKGNDGCTATHPCAAGQGDCDVDEDCMAGLKCGNDNANALWGTGPWSSAVDVCIPDPLGTWVYTPKIGKRYVFRRANWASWGRVHNDGVHKWEYQGSYYTYPAHHIHRAGVGGVGSWNWDACTSGSRCSAGQGDCDNDSDCQNGLVCVHDKAKLYNTSWPTDGDVCDLPHDQTLSTFRGPEYYDGSGTRWVFNRYGGYQERYHIYGNSWSNLKVGLVEAKRDTPQAKFDENLGKVMNHLNDARVGGLWASGGTPTCRALDRAYTHIQRRRNGSGDGFSNPDEAKDCRRRFVILLSDGDSNTGCNRPLVEASARRLYADFGVRVIGMAIPGSSSSGIEEMNAVSDCGDDGNCYNHSSQAVLSNSEKELVDNLRNVIFNAIKGQYTTAPSGVTWSAKSNIEGDVSLTPSTEFPGWRGLLEAKDLLATPLPATKWEAGAKLEGRDWKTRLILSGTHTHNNGEPFRLFDSSGVVDTGAVSAVWPTAVMPVPTTSELQGFIRWLGGKDRDWKLPPIVRSVPASIGPPPAYSALGDHGTFEALYALRQRLVYVISNEGLLHAFDARTGDEVWAFMPPHLLPKAYELYVAGGQSEDPREFKYVAAASPRVDDVRIGGTWRTLLLMGAGPGGENFVALDISEMPTCSDASPPVCTSPDTHVKPKVLFSSYFASPAIDGKLGETWSTPAIYWTGALGPRISMGTGYLGSAADDNRHYNFFDNLAAPFSTASGDWETEEHVAASTARVDFATLADTVAVVDPINVSEIKVSYQADLEGRIWAYDDGRADTVRKIINLGTKQPIHFSPAATYNTSSNTVMLAFASGAYQDDDIKYDPNSGKMVMQEGPMGDFETTFYIYEDDFTSSATEKWSLKATDICTLSTTADFATNCNGGPCTCLAPSERAMVVSSPIIARNLKFGDRTEAFFVLYDPPANICSAGGAACTSTSPCNSWETCIAGTCQSIGIGDSYIYRVVIDPATGTPMLAQAFRHENTQASGLTVVGAGSDVTLSVSGRGSTKAGVQTVGCLLPAGALLAPTL